MTTTLPELPADLAGWTWRRDSAGATYLEGPDGWKTKIYTTRYSMAIAEAQRRVLSQPKAVPAALPPIPDDLPAWSWQVRDAGQVRLANVVEGLHTGPHPRAYADLAIVEARARVAADEALIAQERDALSPAMRARAEGVLDQAKAFIAREQAAQAAPATAWRAGPDAGGVYRRPPEMPEYTTFPARDLVDGRWQPREAYNEADLGELKGSIAEHGVTTPLLVLINEYGEPELIAGHRRKRAVLELDGRDVPARVLEVTAAQAFEIALVENDQRTDLTDLERGRAYERIIAEQGISEVRLAERLGRSRGYVQQRRRIASAAPALQEAVTSGVLGFTHARAICEGAGGDHAIQTSVVEYALKEIRAGRPDRAEDLQKRAERTVRDQAEKALEALGWKVAQFWHGNTSTYLFYAPTVKPAPWSSGEILAVVREARGPSGTVGPLPVAGEDQAILETRGWRLHATCAPWTIAERGKEVVIGDLTDLVDQIAAARKDLAKLAARFEAQGWQVQTGSRGLKLTPPALESGGKAKKVAPIEASFSEAEKIAREVEKGTLPPEKESSSYTYKPTCDICRHKTAEHKSLDGQTVCPSCAPAVEARIERERTLIARALDAQGVPAWLDTAPAIVVDLLLAAHYREWMSDVLGVTRRYASDEQVDGSLQALTPEQRREALGLVAQGLAWGQRPYATARHLAPAPAVAAPAPAPAPVLDDDPATLEAILEALAAIEDRWAAGSIEPDDGERLDALADALDALAEDDLSEGLDDDAYEATIARIGQLQARLDALEEEEVP